MNRTVLLLFPLLAALLSPALQSPPPTPPRLPDIGHEIFYAVLEGLYRDGVSDAAVDQMLAVDDEHAYVHFVPGCPTCIYVLEALRHYRARPDFVSFKHRSDTWGEGLPAFLRERLASDVVETRLAALQELVQKWIGARMDRLRLTDEERHAWDLELRARSKKGMSLLAELRDAGRMAAWGESSCPSCDGAVDGARCPAAGDGR